MTALRQAQLLISAKQGGPMGHWSRTSWKEKILFSNDLGKTFRDRSFRKYNDIGDGFVQAAAGKYCFY